MIALRLACLALAILLLGRFDPTGAQDTPYKIIVHTGFLSIVGTNAVVKISLINVRWSALITLNGPFGPGSVNTFYRTLYNVYPLMKVYVQLNNAGSGSVWHLKKIYIYNLATQVNNLCVCNCWLLLSSLSRVLTCQEV